MKSAVVTGGAGFIGSHLVDALLASGIAVSVIDNLTAGREAHLEAHAADPRFRLVAASVEDAPTIERVFLDARPDVVFHLAALHYIPACDERPGEAVRTNVCGTQSIIDPRYGVAASPRVVEPARRRPDPVLQLDDLPAAALRSVAVEILRPPPSCGVLALLRMNLPLSDAHIHLGQLQRRHLLSPAFLRSGWWRV